MDNIENDLLIIGVSGVTCGGKSSLASLLKRNLSKCTIISQDDYFRSVDDPQHVWISELNHINFDIITSLDMEKLFSDVQKITQGKNLNLARRRYTFLVDPQFTSYTDTELMTQIGILSSESDLEILIIEGFCIFNYEPLLPFIHLKYYFTLSEEECKKRRATRVYEPPDCPGYFEKCVWPEHLKQLDEVQKTVKDVRFFSGENDQRHVLVQVSRDLLMYLVV